MAEPRREEEEGERSDLRDVRSRSQTTDHPERTKPDHLHSSQGPLSSIRAAIKRTKTNSHSDHTRERRRPQITIVSAEPLASNNWFSGASVVFPPAPQSGWSAGIQAVSQPPPSYDQVIQEKTQEEHIVKPTAAPRRAACTTTSATQTEPVRQDASTTVPQRSAAPQAAGKRPAGKKPQKPPRPALPKPVDRQSAAVEKVGTNATVSTSTEDQSDSKSDVKQPNRADSTQTCTRSVTVHWDISTTAAETTPSSSDSEPGQRPVPLPRTKPRKQGITEEVKVQTLVRLSESCDENHSDPEDVSSNKYLKELLEVFSADNEREDNGDVEALKGEDADSEMNTSHSQRNIQARIQAFESQSNTEEGNVVKTDKPEPRPRKAAIKPPVAAKPSVAVKPQLNHDVDDDSQNVSTPIIPQTPTPAPRPQPPKKPAKEEQEILPNTVAIPKRSRPSVLTRANSIHEEEISPVPPIPPAKPPKEPLKPNLNINNHNSASMAKENEYVDTPSNHIPVMPQHNVDSNGGSFARQSLTRRPTTIRVPSKTGSLSDHFQDSPPPLPAQKPIGYLNSSVEQTQNPTPVLPFQESLQHGPDPTLPPRRPNMSSIRSKTLPPRPPPAKTGPGRPPPPSIQGTGRSHSASWEAPPKPQAQKPHRKGPVLPPRPNPGHRLYNKYTLQLPHGIASFDYNGSNTGELSFQKNEVLLLLEEIDHNTFECQVGDTSGRVHKSRMKVITPITSLPQDMGGAGSGGAGSGLKVQAIHDFVPEGPGELGLRAGDVVTMVEQVDSEWYKGTCRGSAGFFPINHVKVLSNSPKPLPEQKAKPPPPAAVSGPRCVARFDFEGEHSDELSFSEGDVIQLKAFVGQDWARGQIGTITGIFPLNFVEVIEDLPPPSSQQKTQPVRIPLPGMVASPNTHPEVVKPARASQPGVEWVVALYDYAGTSDSDLSFQQGDRILITQHVDADWSCGRLNGREGMFPRAFVESSTGQQASSNQQNVAAGGGRAQALFSYTSDCDEELSLQVGDIITNLESVDEEWFLGDLRGRRALVPKNYVQLL